MTRMARSEHLDDEFNFGSREVLHGSGQVFVVVCLVDSHCLYSHMTCGTIFPQVQTRTSEICAKEKYSTKPLGWISSEKLEYVSSEKSLCNHRGTNFKLRIRTILDNIFGILDYVIDPLLIVQVKCSKHPNGFVEYCTVSNKTILMF